MIDIVVDASVAIKWVIGEDDAHLATKLLRRGAMFAPDILLAECANVLWKKVRRSELFKADAIDAIAVLRRAKLESVSTRSLAGHATELSLVLDHPAYDCFYLALAMARDCPLITADRKFVDRVTQQQGNRAILLADYVA